MQLNILAFGIVKEIFGDSLFKLEMNEACSVNELKQTLQERFPRLQQLSSFRIALNQQFASGNEMIAEGDEVAVIPPVSGG